MNRYGTIARTHWETYAPSRVAALPDPLGVGRGLRTLPNGLRLESVSCPLGVIGLIFESRPGVAVEASGLAVKSGNALILRSGSEAFRTVVEIGEALRRGLAAADLPADLVQWVPTRDRAAVDELLHLPGLDLLVPRG